MITGKACNLSCCGFAEIDCLKTGPVTGRVDCQLATQVSDQYNDNMESSHALAGKTSVVTGSSSGIGRAIALQLAAAGANVLVHAGRNHEGAQQVALHARSHGVQSVSVTTDLSDLSTHETFVRDAWNWQNGVDIWMNIAGADVLTNDNAQLPFEEKLDSLWQVDVLATIHLSRLVGERMKQRFADSASAVIINMGWDQADRGMAGDSGQMFAATKGAVMSFSRSLAKSLAPQVRVNCLAPGWIKTAWGEQASDYWQQRAAKQSLLNRWGTPQDVANAALFLASPAADFITGQVIAVNGGMSEV